MTAHRDRHRGGARQRRFGERGDRRERLSGGTRATGTAKLAESGYDQYQNLYWARQTLAGKQLLVRLAD